MNLLWMSRGLAVVTGMFLVAGCNGPEEMAGDSSQTPNALVGSLYEPDGKTPAKDVRVHIRPGDFIAAIPVAGLPGRSADTLTVATDDDGRFAFDTTLDAGVYVIEAQSGNNAVLADSVFIVNNSETDTLAPLILGPVGAIKGAIRLLEGGNPRKVFVRIVGLDRFITVAADSLFTFPDLAEGDYDVSILPTLDDYDLFDTFDIHVKSADTTDLGMIDVPFTGIPTIRNLTIAYDTLMQRVTLRWSRPMAGKANCFNMYRRVIDPTTAIFTQLNIFPIIDTMFIDSFGEQDRTYEYRVTVVDSATTREGAKSGGITIRIAMFDITPQNVAVTYDTLRQRITLHWSDPDTALVAGYNVYRRNVDLNETFWTPFNKSPILDTVFTDSAFNICPNYFFSPSGSMDNTEPVYEYCVAALVNNVREGVRSAAVSARINLKYITPAHVQCLYDTALTAVRLSWSISDATLVTGFHVFRKNFDKINEAFAQINREALSDTVYFDSTGTQNQTYEYYIASIVDGRAEVKSERVRIRTTVGE